VNDTLSKLADEVGLLRAEHHALRMAFGLACVTRVQHLLEDPQALACLAVLRDHVRGECDAAALEAAATEAARIANSHRGSESIDGSAHAAVSATYAVANALAGQALQAAGYAAYASVYAYGGYAVSDPASFDPEIAWQCDELRRLAQHSAGACAVASASS